MPYKPRLHKAQNKPIGLDGLPLDARSMFYNESLRTYRPYNGVEEVLAYLPSARNKRGFFDVFINFGGTLTEDESEFTGGSVQVYWFDKNAELSPKGFEIAQAQINQIISQLNAAVDSLQGQINSKASQGSLNAAIEGYQFADGLLDQKINSEASLRGQADDDIKAAALQKQSISEKDQPGGYAGLNSQGQILLSRLQDFLSAQEKPLASTDSIPVSPVSGGIFRAKMSDIAAFILPFLSQVVSSPFLVVAGSTLPNPINTSTAITIVGVGTFTQTTGGSITTTQPINVLFWSSNGSTGTWSIGLAVVIDVTGKADITTAAGKVTRYPGVISYTPVAASSEFSNGYYVYNTGLVSTGSARRSRYFALEDGASYVGTAVISSNQTALFVYFDINGNYIANGYQTRAPSSGNATYTREPMVRPSNAKFVGMSGVTAQPFPVLEKVGMVYPSDSDKPTLSGGSNKTTAQIDAEKTTEITVDGKILRGQQYTKYTEIIPFEEAATGFYHFQDGTLRVSADRKRRKWDVIDGVAYVITVTTNSNTTAGLIFYDVNGAYINYALRGDTTDIASTRFVVVPPAGTRKIGSDGILSAPYPVLEKAEIVYQSPAYATDLVPVNASLNRILPPDIDVIIMGDSTAARPISFVETAMGIIKARKVVNLAVSSARWSKTIKFGSSYPDSITQNWGQVGFLGVSQNSPSDIGAGGDVNELIKIANNNATVQLQKAIAQFDAGIIDFTPKLILFDFGTNVEYGDGSQVAWGNATTALNGKSKNVDIDTFDMAGSMRWCLQTAMAKWPGVICAVMLPMQRGAQSHNTDQTLPKIAIMKQVCDGMSVGYLDSFSKCGITEKLEVNGGGGQFLVDGVHVNAAGAVVQGRFVGNGLLNLLAR